MPRIFVGTFASLLVLLSIGAMACGGDEATVKPSTPVPTATVTATPGETTTGTAAAGESIAIQLGDFAIMPSAATAAAGPVTFNATNNGQVEHEFVVVKTDLAPDALPLDATGDVDEAKLDSPGEIEGIAPGTSRSKTLDLTPGNYVLICNEPGHYKEGMFAAFQVK